MSTLDVTDLGCEYGGRTIFEGVNCTVSSGEQLAVFGASGSGKTTLLALMAGFGTPAAGRVSLDGQPVDAQTRRRFAIVLQGYGLVSLLTASENVEAALRAAGRAPRAATAAADQALTDVGLAGLSDHLVGELSGGQQQRAAVARALALAPDVLLADEPTAEQDPESRELVLSRLLAAADRGAILVLATHDPEVAARCTKVLDLNTVGLFARLIHWRHTCAMSSESPDTPGQPSEALAQPPVPQYDGPPSYPAPPIYATPGLAPSPAYPPPSYPRATRRAIRPVSHPSASRSRSLRRRPVTRSGGG